MKKKKQLKYSIFVLLISNFIQSKYYAYLNFAKIPDHYVI